MLFGDGRVVNHDKSVDGIGHNGYTKSGKLQAFVPSDQAKLPNLSSGDLPGANLPGAVLPGAEGAGTQALPQGTYKPTLAYPSTATSSSPALETGTKSSVTSSFQAVVDKPVLWRALALAIILLLGGTHLLSWLRRTPIDS